MKTKIAMWGIFILAVFVVWIYTMAGFEAAKPVLKYNLTIPFNDFATHYKVHGEYEGEGGFPERFNIKITPIPEDRLFQFSTKYSHIKQLYCVFTLYEAAGDGYEMVDIVYKTFHFN